MADKHLKIFCNIFNHHGNANQNLRPVKIAEIKNSDDSQDVEKEEHSSIAGGIDCKLVQPLWKSVWQFLRKLDIVLPEDPGILLLGIYPEDAPTGNTDTCFTMFIAALLIITRSWKEPRCPSTEECMQKMMYIYRMEH